MTNATLITNFELKMIISLHLFTTPHFPPPPSPLPISKDKVKKTAYNVTELVLLHTSVYINIF